ncbi:MAG: DUF433 domain-containing protein [Akkermansiaceae bacterium]|nr:DUF433 domain-containing protein [Akkermansiaceae bacterium]
MNLLDRITRNPSVMGGKPCIRGTRVTVGMILGMLASEHSRAELLRLYPYLAAEDIDAALQFGARLAQGSGSDTNEAADRHEPLAPVDSGA